MTLGSIANCPPRRFPSERRRKREVAAARIGSFSPYQNRTFAPNFCTVEAFDFQGYRVLQRSWSCATAGIHVATGSSSRVPHCRERVRSSSKSVRDSEHREPLLARSPPHSRRSMPAPVRRHVNAPGAAGGADKAARPCDSGKWRFRGEADRLEAHGRRSQADRIASCHPCARRRIPASALVHMGWPRML